MSVTGDSAGRPASGAGAAGSGMNSADAYRPLFWVDCAATQDLITAASGTPQIGKDGQRETLLSYVLTIFTTRDADVTCTAAAGSLVYGSGSSFFPNTVAGAGNGWCTATADMPPYISGPAAVGIWQFQTTKAGPQATYVDTDPGHPLNGFKYVFAQADCNAQALGPDLKWSDVKLSDVFD
jgi:hypothetical protein